MKTPDYEAVLADLKSKRDALGHAIVAIEAILPRPAITAAAVSLNETPHSLRVKAIPKTPVIDPGLLTIDAAILKAVSESARTQPEVMDRVEQIRPGSNRASVYACITVLIKKTRLHKDEELKLRLVENGRICA